MKSGKQTALFIMAADVLWIASERIVSLKEIKSVSRGGEAGEKRGEEKRQEKEREKY